MEGKRFGARVFVFFAFLAGPLVADGAMFVLCARDHCGGKEARKGGAARVAQRKEKGVGVYSAREGALFWRV